MNGTRFKNWALPPRYIREAKTGGGAVESAERLEPQAALGETLMLGLRLLENGVSVSQIEKRFRVSFMEVYGKAVSVLSENNLISVDSGRISLTKKGLFLADTVILEFIS